MTTVAELIETLKEYPGEMQVFLKFGTEINLNYIETEKTSLPNAVTSSDGNREIVVLTQKFN